MKRHLLMLVVAWWLCAAPVAGQTSWDYVQALAPGTPVVVATRGELPVSREVVSVDADSLRVRYGARVDTIPRADVMKVSVRYRRRGNIIGAVGGLVAGVNVGMQLGMRLGFKQCGGSCSDEGVLMVLSMVGIPIATTILGSRIPAGYKEHVIYRAPPAPSGH